MKNLIAVLISLYFIICLSGCCCNCAHKAQEAQTNAESEKPQEAEQPAETQEPAQ